MLVKMELCKQLSFQITEVLHAIVYGLGASGLSLVNSITLMTELILKAGKQFFVLYDVMLTQCRQTH